MLQKHKHNLAPEVQKMIRRLGKHISIARKRRGLRMEEMASRMFVSRRTLSRLEKGDPGVSMHVFVTALWILGLVDDLEQVALPEHDKVGKFREQQRLPQRIRKSRSPDDLEF
jgi:transcriptional regulator with XRE-family HTH domain